MAAIDTFETIETRGAIRSANPFVVLTNAVGSFVDRRREHRTIARLSRLPAHVVRDMGFDPEKIAAELQGSWDDVDLTLQARR